MKLSHYHVPSDINYIAVFLTLSCPLKCSYCINRAGSLKSRRHLKPGDWVRGLSRFHTRPDLPLTLQGGEPTSYSGFYEVVAGLPGRLPLDLLTNAQFNLGRFKEKVKPSKFGREAKYAPIRISFHAETMNPVDTIHRARVLQLSGYKVGIWAVDIEEFKFINEHCKAMCEKAGIDFRWKEYLAPPKHGTYRYPEAVNGNRAHEVTCKTSEILIDPAGNFFRCHSDLYANRSQIGNLLDAHLPDFLAERECNMMGHCNPCDVKLKTNRFQEFGHASVTIS